MRSKRRYRGRSALSNGRDAWRIKEKRPFGMRTAVYSFLEFVDENNSFVNLLLDFRIH
jgi:hypothetical protein